MQSIYEKALQFEGSTVADRQPVEIERPDQLLPVMKANDVLRTPQVIRNHELGIHGIPDLIDAGRGKLYPIEIKWHKAVSESDVLELAFYWLLLEPLRKGNPRPKGYLILSTGEQIEVLLSREDLLDVEGLLDRFREDMKRGTEPLE